MPQEAWPNPAGEPGYAVLARELRAAGMETLFGVMGEANLDLIACLSDRLGTRYVAARHEAGAVAMADGFARSSGRIGFATVTCGPGLTNALTALITAVRARAELLLITGQLPLPSVGRSQAIDHGALLAATGAGVLQVASPDELPGAVSRAISLIRASHGPVVLNVLMPVLDGSCQSGSSPPLEVHAPPGRAGAAPEALLHEALGILKAGRRIVVLAGRGAVESGIGPRLAELADRLDANLAVSLLAHGLFAGHPRDLGVAGGLSSPATQEALASADVILAFGASLNGWTTRAGSVGSEARVIHIDQDREAFARATIPVQLAIEGDASEVLEQLLAGVADTGSRSSEAARLTTASVRKSSAPLDPRELCRFLDRVLSRERTVTVDAGHFFEFPTRYLSVPDHRGYLFTISFGTVGLGLGTASGAAFGRPDRLSIAVVGDGGLMMSLTELDVIGRERLPMLILVLNDGAYGAEIKHLFDRGWSTGLARFKNPSFAALAETVGIRGFTIRTLEEAEAIAPTLAHLSGPILIDAHIDPDVKADWMEVMHAARESKEHRSSGTAA